MGAKLARSVQVNYGSRLSTNVVGSLLPTGSCLMEGEGSSRPQSTLPSSSWWEQKG